MGQAVLPRFTKGERENEKLVVKVFHQHNKCEQEYRALDFLLSTEFTPLPHCVVLPRLDAISDDSLSLITYPVGAPYAVTLQQQSEALKG